LFEVEKKGEEGTSEYREYFKNAQGREISPWHHIPLRAGENGVFNAVIEIPKMTRAKMEVATKEYMNPIAQDVCKGGTLREYHGPIYWNYGMIPQTWEDPNVEHAETKCFGDNDPLDVVEIGSAVLAQGTVEPVKPLGALAMLDDGELDWKVIAISVNDPLAAKLDRISDVEDYFPGTVAGIREWFRWYKTPDGKPLNRFGFHETVLDKEKAVDVIMETHEAWVRLVAGEADKNKLWVPESVHVVAQSTDVVAHSDRSRRSPFAFLWALCTGSSAPGEPYVVHAGSKAA